jgi:1-acyl-sn-glycerol-3-phosphate acyltransferase
MQFVIPKAAARIGRRILGLLQIAMAYVIVYRIFGLRTNMRVDRSGIQDVKPPFIVLGNHPSNVDAALVQYIVAPYACYFLTTNYYFRLPIIGRILNIFGAIPKIQFFPDVRSMRGVVEVIARGDVVGIFPEGRRSIDGSSCPIPESIAKLIKKFKVPVVSVRINGGYFIWPRWSCFWRSGRVETIVKQILTTEEIVNMDIKEIHDVVCHALAYNDYDWNNTARVRYHHKKAAEQLHLVLHQCPRCVASQVMRSKGTRLFCSVCGNSAVMDEYGFLQPLDDQCVVFGDPVKWNAWQRRKMIVLLQDDDFQIHAKVKDLRIADKYYGAYRSCGYGEIFLRKDGMHFLGTVDGHTTELFFPIEIMPSVSTEFNNDFEVCDHKNAWWFFLEEEQQTVRIEMAISLMYEQKHA